MTRYLIVALALLSLKGVENFIGPPCRAGSAAADDADGVFRLSHRSYLPFVSVRSWTVPVGDHHPEVVVRHLAPLAQERPHACQDRREA